MTEQTEKRNYWPVMLFSIPFTAVLFGIFMIATTLYFPDDLVVDNYYKDGMAINELLVQDELAKELSIEVTLNSLTENRMELTVLGATDSAISMNLFHVTDQASDVSLLLVPEEGFLYSVDNTGLSVLGQKGVWYIELKGTDKPWRVKQRIVTPISFLEIRAGLEINSDE